MGRADPGLAVAVDTLHAALSDPGFNIVARVQSAPRGGMTLVFDVLPASARRVKRSERSFARLQRRGGEPTAPQQLRADAAPFVPAPAARALACSAERAEAEPPEAAERPAEQEL